MRCQISSLVVKLFKYKICDICLPYVDLIRTHVLHLIYLWVPVHLMNYHVIRIGYVQGMHDYIDMSQFITSFIGLRPNNLITYGWENDYEAYKIL